MKTTLQKWGNSYAMRIAKNIAESIDATVGTEFTIEKTKDGMILKMQKKANKYNLDEILKKTSKKNLHSILLNDKPKGKEVW